MAKVRVLIIDDQREAAESLRMLLELSGYEARVANSGPDGLRAAGEWGPDVVLSDLRMPGLDGYEVARELRRRGATAHVRLVALTGYGGAEDRRLSREAGFEYYFVKPVNLAALLGVLGRN